MRNLTIALDLPRARVGPTDLAGPPFLTVSVKTQEQ